MPRPAETSSYACLDHGRRSRVGLAEAVYAPSKTAEQCAAIVAELLDRSEAGPVLLTRANADQTAAALERNPGATTSGSTLVWRADAPGTGRVAVLTAGTADLAVADECVATLCAYGVTTTLLTDVGVAGIHRVLDVADQLTDVDTVIVVAGMEGALASVVGGLVAAPIIAVPTSTGYGASLEGVTALLAMLASCAQGLSVVGIDNGFGAACAALRLLNRIHRVELGETVR